MPGDCVQTSPQSASVSVSSDIGKSTFSSLSTISSTAATAGCNSTSVSSLHSPTVTSGSASAVPTSFSSLLTSSSLPHMTFEGPVMPARSRNGNSRCSLRW